MAVILMSIVNLCSQFYFEPYFNSFQGSQCLDQFNAAEYCQVVIFSNVVCSLIPLPPTYEFQEFPFKVSCC